ncbi:MAG: guanylate kinase [Deltaproteobacteria bacterium]|nr:MAG: guanylate kinase [Deltaproteobacteria bacterium]
MSRGNLIVISAPSGTGKTTVCRELVKRMEGLVLSTSYTTRPKKEGERDGIDYFFVSPERFDEMASKGEFLEWAEIYGWKYGTSRKVVEEKISRGVDVLLEIDVQGGRIVKEKFPDAVLIALFPPGRETLIQRLLKRGRDRSDEIEKRVAVARRELEVLLEYDYYIINENLDETISKAILIIEAQRQRVACRREELEKIVSQFGGDK